MEDRERAQREVVVEDPDLTPDANRALTDEARKAIGAKRVPVRDSGSGAARLPGGTQSRFAATVSHNRLFIGLALFVLLLLGVMASLATGQWLFLALAVFAHAGVTVVWAFFAIQLAGEPEHAAPRTAAMLEEEGVPDPDARLGRLVEELEGHEGAGRRAEPARTVDEAAPSFMIWLPAAGLLIVSALTPFVTDGPALWLVPVILWPLVIGTLAFAWGKPEGMTDAITEHPRAVAAAMACAVVGVTLLVVGAA